MRIAAMVTGTTLLAGLFGMAGAQPALGADPGLLGLVMPEARSLAGLNAAAAKVSLGWVSAVRQQLLAREWAAEAPGGLRVTKPEAVLDAWVKADDWHKRTRTQEYSVLNADPVNLAAQLRDLLGAEPLVFTQWLAGWLRHPYTTPAVVTAYVKHFPDDAWLREKLLARRVPSGGGLRLVRPTDEGVWNPTQTVQGFQLVSDVQIVLDLARAGLRADEQAEELRRATDFAGGWA